MYEYLFPKTLQKIQCIGKLSSNNEFVIVENTNDMDTLWRMGFFGKGTLSRSEPAWYLRMAMKLGIEKSDKVSAEDITSMRRLERKKFKQERAKAELEALEERRKLDEKCGREMSSDPVRSTSVSVEGVSSNSDKKEPQLKQQDFVVDGKLVQREYLQLMPYEALFLSFALGAVCVLSENRELLPQELFKVFAESNNRFIYDYVTYHHFRSKGWCVRSGVKFGTDFILYRRGPPFSHAEFAIMVMPVTEKQEKQWYWNSSIGRVIGGVKKTLVFCYVEKLRELPNIDNDIDLTEVLKSFRVREVVYRRWIPARNRD